MGGYGSRHINYEGYGKTKKEAAINLDSLLKYHYDGVFICVAKEPKTGYYVLDGRGEHPVSFDQQHKWIRAYVSFY
jgi:hypothetical protein